MLMMEVLTNMGGDHGDDDSRGVGDGGLDAGDNSDLDEGYDFNKYSAWSCGDNNNGCGGDESGLMMM